MTTILLSDALKKIHKDKINGIKTASVATVVMSLMLNFLSRKALSSAPTSGIKKMANRNDFAVAKIGNTSIYTNLSKHEGHRLLL